MQTFYSNAVCLLDMQACAKLYGGTGGTTENEKKPTNGGSTTCPSGHVIPKGGSPEPDPDI